MNNRRVNIAEVTAPNFLRRSQNTYIRGIVLVIKKYDRPLQLYRPQNAKSKRPASDSHYDRLVIMGDVNNKECFAIISESAQKSARLFQDRSLTVGSIVDVFEPVYNNACIGNDRNNPILESATSLNVVENNADLLPIPINLNPNSMAMFHFCLPNRELLFLHATAVAPTCAGYMCDRRKEKNESNCACLQKPAVSAWCVSARVITANIDNEEDDALSGETLQGLSLTKLFCSEAIVRSAYSSIDKNLLRTAVTDVQNHVNANGGWQVSGYYKCGSTEENIAQHVQRVRICRITAAVDIPDHLKYQIVAFDNNDNQPPPQHLHANPNIAAADVPNNRQ